MSKVETRDRHLRIVEGKGSREGRGVIEEKGVEWGGFNEEARQRTCC